MKKIIFVVLSILIIGCKKSEKKEVESEIKKPEVKLFQLVGGSILVNKLEVFSQDTTYTGQNNLPMRIM